MGAHHQVSMACFCAGRVGQGPAAGFGERDGRRLLETEMLPAGRSISQSHGWVLRGVSDERGEGQEWAALQSRSWCLEGGAHHHNLADHARVLLQGPAERGKSGQRDTSGLGRGSSSHPLTPLDSHVHILLLRRYHPRGGRACSVTLLGL